MSLVFTEVARADIPVSDFHRGAGGSLAAFFVEPTPLVLYVPGVLSALVGTFVLLRRLRKMGRMVLSDLFLAWLVFVTFLVLGHFLFGEPYHARHHVPQANEPVAAPFLVFVILSTPFPALLWLGFRLADRWRK